MHRAKILVVEDEALSAMALAEYLDLLGYELCTPASSAEEATCRTSSSWISTSPAS